MIWSAASSNIACHGCGGVMARNNAIYANGSFWCDTCVPPPSADFGAQVGDALAKQREIGGPANDTMRVPSFEETEAERARLAEYFKRNGVL